VYLSERELLALIRRVDTQANQVISIEEFEDFIVNQIGFQSKEAVLSLARGTDEMKHQNYLKSQKK
jgi:hypothetical protein